MKKDNIKKALEEIKALDQRDTMQESMLSALSHMAQEGLHGFADINELTVEFGYSGGLSQLHVEMQFDQIRKCFIMYGKLPLNCRKEKLSSVSELICRINFGIVLGCFEFDPRDGECKFKYTQYIGDTAMSEDQVKHAIGITVSSVHRYEDTLVPIFLGMEPDVKKSCMEYDMMKNGDEPSSLLKALRQSRQTDEAAKDGTPESAMATFEHDLREILGDDSFDFDALLKEEAGTPANDEAETGFFTE